MLGVAGEAGEGGAETMTLPGSVLGSEDCRRTGSICAGLADATVLAGWRFIFAGGGATAQVRQEKFVIAGMQRIQLHGLRKDQLQIVMPFLLLLNR